MEIFVFSFFIILLLICLSCNSISKSTTKEQQSVSNAEFLRFQKSFFVVYFLALLGDWLQGPYVYKIYEYYGFNEIEIALLYVTGFASSVLFGTVTGPCADRFGRKTMAIVYCILYSVCCVTKLFDDFTILQVGRICGGIATSILFSTFESWYIYEHVTRHGFPNDWIGVTFSKATFYNGLLAILAGVVSNVLAETFDLGPSSPFVFALIPLCLCGIWIKNTWNENYGNNQITTGLKQVCMEGLMQIYEDVTIFYLGVLQSVVESVMYIFVFLWTPVLSPANPPLGMIFACFMVCIMIGSGLFSILMDRKYNARCILRLVLALMFVSMITVCFMLGPKFGNFNRNSLIVLFVIFCVLEVAFGMYFPAMSLLKSQAIPESHRANVMNWFRVPTNIITCGALLSSKITEIAEDKRIIFGGCAVLLLIGMIFGAKLSNLSDKETNSKEKGKIEVVV